MDPRVSDPGRESLTMGVQKPCSVTGRKCLAKSWREGRPKTGVKKELCCCPGPIGKRTQSRAGETWESNAGANRKRE